MTRLQELILVCGSVDVCGKGWLIEMPQLLKKENVIRISKLLSVKKIEAVKMLYKELKRAAVTGRTK